MNELVEALKKCREMVGHPDNIAYIDGVLAAHEAQQAEEPVAWLDKSGPGPLSVRISAKYDYGCTLPHDTKFFLHPAPADKDFLTIENGRLRQALKTAEALNKKLVSDQTDETPADKAQSEPFNEATLNQIAAVKLIQKLDQETAPADKAQSEMASRPTAGRIKLLADKMADAKVAMGIPTGQLYRGIAYDQHYDARKSLFDAIDAFASPAPADKDAERYRWLRKEHDVDAPVGRVVWKKGSIRNSSDWCDLIDGNDLDNHIDAAMEVK